MPIRKILIVDDSATERHILSTLLTGKGYQISIAENGEDGVAKSKTEKPDLILMDVVMPGLNGFQATRAITTDEATKHIPIIMCTTKNMETDRVWGLRQGAKEFVTKPVNEAELLGKIAALR